MKLFFCYARLGLKTLWVDKILLLTDFVLATAFPLLVQALLWRAVYAGSSHAELQGFSQSELIFYYACALFLGRLNNGYDVISKLSYDIHEGTLDLYLVKPFPLLAQRLFTFLGESFLYFLPVVGLLLLKTIAFATLSPGFTILFLGLVLPLSQILCFCLAALLACLTTWFVRLEFLLTLYIGLSSVLGGLLLPADFWPVWIRGWMRHNPFALFISRPAELLTHPSVDQALYLLFETAAMLAGSAVVLYFLWKKVKADHESVGG